VTKGVTLRTDLAPAPTMGDPALLERLVGNLVENAVRHNLLTDGWVEVRAGSSRGQATLVVTNSGSVIAPHHVSWLFEPFRRQGTDRTRTDGGFGLGLSIVQSVVQAHRGQVTAQPPESGGMEITISLPAAPPSPRPSRASPRETVTTR
jgi:signal transduction histidine kinase